MKTLKHLFCLGTLGLIAAANPVSAQTGLGIQIYPGTNITGAIGSVYSIQATTNLAQNSSWSTVAVVQLTTTNYVWFDTSFQTNSQRFYRTLAFTNVVTNMVFIPAGTFLMGIPTNYVGFTNTSQQPVTISQGFFMEKYLVTQTNYFSVVGNNPSHFSTNNPFNPVETVSWSSATNYCALRTALERAAGKIPTNWSYRLPTSAEWEYACRAGSTAAYYLGSHLYSGLANFAGTNEYDSSFGETNNTTGIYLQTTTPVGNYSANGWGLYDMIGNVWEWCQDLNGDPQGTTGRVTRGGGWSSSAIACGSGSQSGVKNGGASLIVGFRVVLSPNQ